MTPTVRPTFGQATSRCLKQLLADGYVIIPNAVSQALVACARADLEPCFARAPLCSGLFYGETTKRFGRLLTRLSEPERFALDPQVMEIVRGALGVEQVQLNLTQAIEIHPGAQVQVPHRDHDMWGCPKSPGMTHMVNVMWPLDAFTAENGATRIWPGSHADDWSVMLPEESQAVDGIAEPGAAILFLGQTLHAGGANRSNAPRRGLIFSYCLDWLLPDENPWLAYPPQVARDFSHELAALAGYRQRFAGLNNFEGSSPAVLLQNSAPDFFQFTDDMSSEQQDIIKGYYSGRHARAPG